MKAHYRNLLIAGVILLLIGFVWYRDNLRGIWPAILPAQTSTVIPSALLSPGATPVGSGNTTGLALTIPPGFSISTFAKNLPGARVIVQDTFGNLWVSQPSEGVVTQIELDDSGRVVRQNVVFKNLRKPHGLAFDPAAPTMLYIAEENKISRIPTYSDGSLEKIADLPAGGNHTSRTLGFGPDGRLYVSIGSTCNVCNEQNNMRAKIFSMKKDGSDLKEYARGLRNAVFFTWHPNTKQMWATEMGRDLLGDNTPPDEVNIIQAGKNYGWPICYGKNTHDTQFDKNTYIRNPCEEPTEIPSYIDLQAHSAPLGLAFVTSSKWPAEYRNNLIVAFHGSWNRTQPTGYKLVRFKLDNQGRVQGAQEDFISGWLRGNTASGRPVDVVMAGDTLYISDDKAGVIYKITPP